MASLESSKKFDKMNSSLSKFTQDESLLDPENPKMEFITLVFFVFSGMSTLSIYFIMLAQVDDFGVLYPGQNYSFQVVTPQFISIPISLLGSKLLEGLALPTKIIGLIALNSAIFMMLPLIPIFLPHTTFYYYCMMMVYLVTSSGSLILQSGLFACLQIYSSTYVVIFFYFPSSF